jgi:RNA polymerase sigma-70 factor (ECF subfamily)
MQNDPIKSSDTEIVRRVLNGDVNAFESLLIRYKDTVLKIVKKHVPYNDVEETIQNVFLRAYQSLPSFKGESGFRQWLSSIAVKTCYDFWRKTYRSREVPMSVLAEKHQNWLEEVITEQSEQAINEKGSKNEARELLDWALRRLSAEDRMVMELVYLEGLSGKEAADLLGWSVSNVKVRCFRSRKKLEKILEAARQK